MSSKLEICNMALGLVGAKRILSLTENNNRAQVCADMYPLARDVSLEERQWSFAYRQAILSPSGTPPEFGFKNKFPIPADTLRIIRADSHELFRTGEYWEMDDGHILSDSDIMYAQLVYRALEASFSSSFAVAVAHKLASDICVPLTKNLQLASQLLGMWEVFISKAASTDGMQGKRQEIKASKLVGARNMGAGFLGSTR